MAKRIIETNLWNDELIGDFTVDERYFWLYLLTNPHTNILGIYRVSLKTMAFELGFDRLPIEAHLRRFQDDHGLIRVIGDEIAIKNFLVYGVSKGGTPVECALTRELKRVRNPELILWVYENIKNRSGMIKTVTDTIEKFINENNLLSRTCVRTREKNKYIINNTNNGVNDNNIYAYTDSYHESYHESSTQKKPEEETTHKYGEYGWVKLTDKQHEKLLADLGEEELKRCITYVDEAAQSTSNKNKWKDWNLVIRRCHRDGWGLNKNNSNAHKDVRRENLEAWLKNSENDADVVESSGEFVDVEGFTI